MPGTSNIFVVFCCLFIGVSSPAHAKYSAQGWGRVSMQGAIIDTACAIELGNRDQTIDMAVVPIADIIRDGQGGGKSFVINLNNCELQHSAHQLPDWKNFQVTFDGDAEGDSFKVQGSASGIALQISDIIGNIVKPGKPLPLENIIPGNMTLNYTIKLVKNNHALKSGEYSSSIRFKLNYF